MDFPSPVKRLFFVSVLSKAIPRYTLIGNLSHPIKAIDGRYFKNIKIGELDEYQTVLRPLPMKLLFHMPVVS